jgi:hypothetical protein
VIRWSLFVLVAAALVASAFWVYLRVELAVPWARRLAAARALALVLILALLFDFHLPGSGGGASSERWVLLDASLSMGAASPDGPSAWVAASARAAELEADGWRVVTFGTTAAGDAPEDEGVTQPAEAESQLAPALRRAAEAGVRRVRVLSDLRLHDQVAVRAALASLPLEVGFERLGGSVVNAGVSSLDVPDLVRPEGSVTAEVEVHATGGDSLTVRVFEEDRLVAEVRVGAPSPGLRARVPAQLPTPTTTGRVRYTASVTLEGDGFPSDDVAVSYASVGHEEGALVLVSLHPDWEPRYLLPVLQEVTGLGARGYLRVGPDAFVPMGRGVDRGAPLDSASVRRAAADAAVLVLHGLGEDADAWVRTLTARSGRSILLPVDAAGAELAGISSGEPQGDEWYASADVPTSPIAGSLSGLTLQGLPPLTGVLLPDDPARVRGALLVQLRGAGAPEAAIHLEAREDGRAAVVLASGLWRWAARENGREAYRRVWSGVAGWLLEDESSSAIEVRPVRWVVGRGEPVVWSAPADSTELRLVVVSTDSVVSGVADSVVVDAVVASAPMSTGVLPPGAYRYRVSSDAGELVTEGRFDVAAATTELIPPPVEPAAAEGVGPLAVGAQPAGQPLRTRPWPYLLVIGLLCGEWIGRRRSGLR